MGKEGLDSKERQNESLSTQYNFHFFILHMGLIHIPQYYQCFLNLTTLLLDNVEEFFWSTGIYFLFLVGIDCFQVVVLCFYFRPRDRPTVPAFFSPRQQFKELIEVKCGQGLPFSDLQVRQVVVPNLLRVAPFVKE